MEIILSVGIDIGTSTTQLILSKLHIENIASSFSIPRVTISDNEIIYKSEIILTPILENNLIDAVEVNKFVESEYKKANISKETIQMGAIIITGETARKDNASNVLNKLSGFAGDFVVATAGPDLESIIAGKGSGANVYSKDNRTSIANLDIGGGTTNIALFNYGELISTGCLDIGGRLIKLNTERKITYIAPKISHIIKEEKLNLEINTVVTEESLKPIIKIMVNLLENSVGLGEKSKYYDMILITKGLDLNNKIECISFSGGVADCILENEDIFKYGDIGILLGKEILKSKLFKEKSVIKTNETIRATVVGAGSHTTEISGSTITYRENFLPIRNIPILKLSSSDESDINNIGKIIKNKVDWFSIENESQLVALAFTGKNNPTFDELIVIAKNIVEGMEKLIIKNEPLIILIQEDMAKALGQSLFTMLPKNYPFVCLDSIRVDNGDYIDIGSPIMEGSVIPVVIKTLAFN